MICRWIGFRGVYVWKCFNLRFELFWKRYLCQVRAFTAVMLKHLALVKPAAIFASNLSSSALDQSLSPSSAQKPSALSDGSQQLMAQLEEVISNAKLLFWFSRYYFIRVCFRFGKKHEPSAIIWCWLRLSRRSKLAVKVAVPSIFASSLCLLFLVENLKLANKPVPPELEAMCAGFSYLYHHLLIFSRSERYLWGIYNPVYGKMQIFAIFQSYGRGSKTWFCFYSCIWSTIVALTFISTGEALEEAAKSPGSKVFFHMHFFPLYLFLFSI